MALTTQRPKRDHEARKKILHEVTGTVEKKRRLNAEIEDSLYRKMKMRSIEDGRNLSDITRELWIEYLSKF